MTQICIAAYAYGVVQGVGFRYSVQQQAKELGLTGYARNLDDGSVEVVVCGAPEQVDQLTIWLKNGGPRNAKIERLLVEPRGITAYSGFSIRY